MCCDRRDWKAGAILETDVLSSRVYTRIWHFKGRDDIVFLDTTYQSKILILPNPVDISRECYWHGVEEALEGLAARRSTYFINFQLPVAR